MKIVMTKIEVEHCHRHGKNSKSTVNWFVSRKHCKAILNKKFDTSKPAFESNVKVYISENLKENIRNV